MKPIQTNDPQFTKFMEAVNKLVQTKDIGLITYYADYTDGKKYIRIISGIALGSRSCYCFVDKTNGNILKSSSWKAPCLKNPRSNIWDDDCGMSGLTPYGAVYLN